MEEYLKTLLHNSFISRKQYRELLKQESLDERSLGALLIENEYLNEEDWKSFQQIRSSFPGGGENPAWLKGLLAPLRETARRLARKDITVLFIGERGTGKSGLARYMHGESSRRMGPYLRISCARLSDAAPGESFFGPGEPESIFAQGRKGSVFWEDLSGLSGEDQEALAACLKKLGYGRPENPKNEARLFLSERRSLEEQVRSGRFDPELYRLLNAAEISLPALRNRPDDIPDLVRTMLKEIETEEGIECLPPEPELEELLIQYDWPGNMLELKNCVQRLAVLSRDGRITREGLPPSIQKSAETSPETKKSPPAGSREAGAGENEFASLKEMERKHVQEALRLARGNVLKAAGLLQIHRNTLARKLEEMGISAAAFKKSGGKKGRRTEESSS